MKITELAEDRLAVQINDNSYADVNTHEILIRLMKNLKADVSFPLKNVNVSYTSVTVQWDLFKTDIYAVKKQIERVYREVEALDYEHLEKTIVKIPVCYDAAFGIDQKIFNIKEDELIKRHTAPLYRVYMLGFLPGFPYLGGLDETLYQPRQETPRRKVERGSVGIGGTQTGVYPIDAPGGWNIIGKTPIHMIEEGKPVVEPGDYIKFYSISTDEYWRIYHD